MAGDWLEFLKGNYNIPTTFQGMQDLIYPTPITTAPSYTGTLTSSPTGGLVYTSNNQGMTWGPVTNVTNPWLYSAPTSVSISFPSLADLLDLCDKLADYIGMYVGKVCYTIDERVIFFFDYCGRLMEFARPTYLDDDTFRTLAQKLREDF